MDKMREQFEKHAYCWAASFTRSGEEYCDDEVNSAWLYFKAGAAWQAAQAVPVEDYVISIAGAYESGIGHCNDTLCNPYKVGSAESFAYDYGKEFGKARGIEQSAPEVVPIVSKTVGYLAGGTLMRRKIQGYDCKPLIVQPATSITAAAELEQLRVAARALKERLRDALKYYGTHSSACDMSRFVNPAGCTCGYDAAIAAEGSDETDAD